MTDKAIAFHLPAGLDAEVNGALEDWRSNGKVERLWRGDATLWSNTDEAKWLGWLGIAGDQLARIEHLNSIADAIDLPVPSQKYTFGVVKAAQARSDFQVLAQ